MLSHVPKNKHPILWSQFYVISFPTSTFFPLTLSAWLAMRTTCAQPCCVAVHKRWGHMGWYISCGSHVGIQTTIWG